jgi:hypothetical protein
MTVKIEIYHDAECWCARGVNFDIYTCSKNLDELIGSIKDAVACHFEDELKAGKKIEISICFNTEAELES